MHLLTGITGAVVAGLFWGSNFVVTKQHDMKDGMYFQFLLCTGIQLTGIATLMLGGGVRMDPPNEEMGTAWFPDFQVTLSTEGLLGGSLWCLGNLMTVPIVESLGLGIGMALWGGTSLIVSFIVGRTRLFGLEPVALEHPVLAFFGVLAAVGSLIIFSKVNLTGSTAEESGENDQHVVEPLMPPYEDDTHTTTAEANITLRRATHPQDNVDVTEAVQEQIRASKPTKYNGIGLALAAGTLYGVSFVPFTLHNQNYPKPDEIGDTEYQMRFFFSQFTGIFLTSVISFAVYTLITSNRPQVIPPGAIVPSIFSGIVWAVAGMGSMVATGELGLSVGYPLSTNASFLVNSIWALFVFREVEHEADRKLYILAGVLTITSCILFSAAV